MILVFLGPPGSGKGTQAKLLAEKLQVPHICVGDMLREEVRQKTELGQRAKELINAGKLAPEGLTIELTRKRVSQPDCGSGFILDGFPRSFAQAEAFDKMLKAIKQNLDKVVYFEADVDQVVERLCGRRSCKECGAVFHVKFNPPKQEGKCDQCGAKLFQRQDDEEGAIRTRFAVYAQETEPLVKRYEKAQKLVRINAASSIEDVFKSLLKLVGHGGD